MDQFDALVDQPDGRWGSSRLRDRFSGVSRRATAPSDSISTVRSDTSFLRTSYSAAAFSEAKTLFEGRVTAVDLPVETDLISSMSARKLMIRGFIDSSS